MVVPPNPTGSHSLTGVPESAPCKLEDRTAKASHSSLAAMSTVTGVLVPRSDARNRTALGPECPGASDPICLGLEGSGGLGEEEVPSRGSQPLAPTIPH